MSYKGLPEKLVVQISPLNVRAYAASTGWRRTPGGNGKVAIFTHPVSELDQLIIPMDSGVVDYANRMAEVMVGLAERENRSPGEVLNDLLLPPADVLRFRLVEPESEAGAVPLEQGIDLLMGAKKALLAAACSVIQPQRFHPRLSRAEAEQLVAASRMGQTERASFSVTVACPLDAVAPGIERAPALPLFAATISPELEEPPVPLIEPFVRRTTRLLIQSAARIAAAVEADDLRPLTSTSSSADVSVSANLCDALLMMKPAGDRSRLVLSASWSRAIPRPPVDVPSSVDLRGDYFAVIEALSRDLRPAREPKSTHLIGLVDALLGDPDDDGRVRGDVQLLILNQEGSTRARVTLDPHDYHVAWEAHIVGGFVSLNGNLIQGGRAHRIDQVSNFKLLSE